ncbi:MAG: glycosyltransferase family 4 protein [Gemmatimonadaceae bacterium]
MRRVGLVHDYLLVMRGAERTFAAMAEHWPDAPIHTLLYDDAGTQGAFRIRDVRSSYLQHLRVGQAGFRRLLPFYTHAVEQLDMGGYDLLLSSSSAFAHGVQTEPGVLHICYCHTPFRYAWHERARAIREAPWPLRPVVAYALDRIRRWDLEVSGRVTHYIANSQICQRRIHDFYGRDAPIIHPPVEVDRFHIGSPQDYFLCVSEVVAHKRVELALEAAYVAGRRIKVVGTGPELERLRACYGGRAEFLGRVNDAELADLYAHARAAILPNVEEFGIAAVEAQAAGRPVVAFDAGGAQETVVDGETGVLVPQQTVAAFAEALRETDFDRYDPYRIRKNATRFSKAEFQRKLSSEVQRCIGEAGVTNPRSRRPNG